MADVRTSRRWVPRALVLLAGAGALAVVGYLASIFIREELAIAALHSPDPERRAAAAATLGELGTVRAIPALLDCERPEEESEDVSRVVYSHEPAYAFKALERILRASAAPELGRLIGDARAANRVWAAGALGRIEALDEQVFHALKGGLEDKEDEVVEASAASLLRFGRAATPCLVDVLRRRPQGEETNVEYSVRRSLQQLGPLAWPAVEVLAPRITDSSFQEFGLLSRLEYLDAGVWGCIGTALEQRLGSATSEEQEVLVGDLYIQSYDLALGLRAADLAPALEALLDHESPALRNIVVPTLKWCTGTVSEKMLHVALELVREKGDAVYFAAFYHIAPASLVALRPLLQPLKQADPDRYELLLHTLAESAAHYPAALVLLQERGVSAESLPKLRDAAEPEKSLVQWLDQVRGEDSERHSEAIERLRSFKLCAADIPFLERSLADPDATVAAMAAHLLGRLGPAAGAARQALEAVAQRESLTARLHAALTLCRLGSARRELEPVFDEACKVERLEELGVEGRVRLRIGDETELRQLLLGEADEKVAAHAITALERMGPDAALAVPLLRGLVRDEVVLAPAQPRAIRGAIGKTVEVSFFFPSVSWLRRRGMDALVAVAPSPATAKLLAEFLLDSDEEVSDTAVRGLLELAPHAAGTVPFLLSCLRRSHRALQASVILSRIGAPAVPALLEALDDADADLRTWAAWTLGGMEAVAAGAVEALERRLKDPDELTRAAAGHALGLIGESAERSRPALAALEKDSSSLVRRQAATALRRLRDPSAWRPGRRDLPPEDDFRCGNAILEEQERFHHSLCERHAPP